MKRTIQHILLESSRLEYDAFHRTTPIPVNSHVHNHLCFEFYLFISGAERFFVNDHILTLQENDLLIFPPFQIHGMPGSKEGIYERMVIYLHPELINKLTPHGQAPQGGLGSTDDIVGMLGKMLGR